MKFLKVVFIVFYLLLCIRSCNTYPDGVRESLKLAGSNKEELKMVIRHYKKNCEDSLKLQSAFFLIDNMKWHSGPEIQVPASLWKNFEQEDMLVNYFLSDTSWKSDWSLKGYKLLLKKELLLSSFDSIHIVDSNKSDLHTVNATTLIQNIEYAFKVKELPWNKDFSFKDFCEYILPYRSNTEPITFQRKNIFDLLVERYSESYNGDPEQLIHKVNNYIYNFNWDWDEPSMTVADLGFFNIFYWNLEEMYCRNHVAIENEILRALGIPSTEVFTPKWSDMNLGHVWSGLYKSDGDIKIYSAIYEKPGENQSLWGYKRATKFYERTFSKNENSPYFTKASGEIVPPPFNSPCIWDITDQFVETSDIKSPIEILIEGKNLAYFCTFLNGTWLPISYAVLHKDSTNILFEKIPVNTIGAPFIYDEDGMQRIGPLIQIEEDNSYTRIKPDGTYGALYLTRKFPQKERMKYFTNKIVGSKIQAADSKDFRYPITLKVLTDTLEPYLQDIEFYNGKKYKYYRIISPEYKLYIAELEFITDDPNIGELLASPLPVFTMEQQVRDSYFCVKGDVVSQNRDKLAFDKVILTYTESQWLGIELDKPALINRIRMVPRNADNGIKVGDVYELYYWENDWIYFFNKTAKENYLDFENVPLGTVYLLRNLSRGKEEMPFLYIESTQYFK